MRRRDMPTALSPVTKDRPPFPHEAIWAAREGDYTKLALVLLELARTAPPAIAECLAIAANRLPRKSAPRPRAPKSTWRALQDSKPELARITRRAELAKKRLRRDVKPKQDDWITRLTLLAEMKRTELYQHYKGNKFVPGLRREGRPVTVRQEAIKQVLTEHEAGGHRYAIKRDGEEHTREEVTRLIAQRIDQKVTRRKMSALKAVRLLPSKS